MTIGRGTSEANRASVALNSSWESTTKTGRSGVGREVPPLRSGNQNSCNSVMPISCQPSQPDSESLWPDSLIHFMPMRSRTYYVCVPTYRGGTLCTGVAGDSRGSGQHREGTGSAFNTTYNGPRPAGHGRQDIAPLADTPVRVSPRLFFQFKTWRRGADSNVKHRHSVRPRQDLRR